MWEQSEPFARAASAQTKTESQERGRGTGKVKRFAYLASIVVHEESQVSSGASEPPGLPGCAASPIAITGTNFYPQELCHPSGSERSSSFRCRHSECVETFRRTSGTAGHNAHEPPYPCERR